MERSPAEPKRSRKDKAKKEPVDDEGDEEEEELAVGGGGGGEGMEEEEKWKLSSATASGAGAASSGGGGIVGVARRGSGGGGGGPQPCCQAERCTADLTEAKRYYRRHKVCEVHSKAPVVVVAGLRQRFCQQCSRFHELSEFDEAKRSCRRRLAGHNERRRKTSSESQTEGSNHCRQADSGGRMQISVSGNPTYKHFQIR